MYQNGARDAGYSGASHLLLTDRGEKVVAGVKMVESVWGRDAEGKVCPSNLNERGFSVEASHILQDRAIPAFGDRYRAKGGHLL